MGLSASWVGLLTAVVAVANVSGNIVAGRALQHGAAPRNLLQAGFAGMGVCTLLAYGQWQGEMLPTAIQFVAVMLFSAVGGLIPATLFSMAVRLAPSENTISTTVGYVQQWSALGQFMGPPVVAWVAAQVGGWQLTWCVTGSLCVMGMVLARLIERSLIKTQTT
jgi:MFS family permease